MVLTARDAVLITPRVALANDSTRLACRSPSNRPSRKPCTWSKQRVRLGVIACPANRVACGETRQLATSGNRYVTYDAMRIQTGRPGVFSENPAALTDSFVIGRAHPGNEGMGEVRHIN